MNRLFDIKSSFSTHIGRNLLILCIIMALLFAVITAYQRSVLAAQSQRFGLVVVQGAQSVSANTNSNTTGTMVVATEQQAPPMINLADAQQKVSFVIPRPLWLPDHLSMLGARVGSGPNSDNNIAPIQVTLIYGRTSEDTNSPQLVMSLDIFSQPAIRGGIAVPDFAIKEMRINGQPAVFAQGAWNESGQWDVLANDAMLSWADSRFTYVLSISEFAITINADDLMRVASSINNQ